MGVNSSKVWDTTVVIGLSVAVLVIIAMIVF